MNINDLTIKSTLKKLKNKEFSVVELVQSYLDQINKRDKKINAFITVNTKNSLQTAQKLDKEGINLDEKPLSGIPIALKDLYNTKNLLTTAGSKILKNYIPPYDATVVKKLKDAGAIIIGKLNEDAWGHGADGTNNDYGPTLNPLNADYLAGGSSSGSAASIADNMVLATGGTDTGGSIRTPSSICGVVGLKPTYGRVSRYGIISMSSSLDTIGHVTKTVWDNAKYLETTAGKDHLDATTPDIKVPRYTQHINIDDKQIKKTTIGIPKEYFGKGIDPEVKKIVRQAIDKLSNQGFNIQSVSLPHTEYGVATYYIIQPSEVSSNLGRYDGIRYGQNRGLFTTETKRRIMIGTYALSSGYYDAYYKKAQKVRTLINQDFTEVFKKVDILIAPVLPFDGFKRDRKLTPLQLYMADALTIPSSMAGLPALSVPAGLSKNGVGIGIQLIGPQFSEQLLFQVGHFWERVK